MWDYAKKGEPLFRNFELYPKDDGKNKDRRE
jgi:hypothetical protein